MSFLTMRASTDLDWVQDGAGPPVVPASAGEIVAIAVVRNEAERLQILFLGGRLYLLFFQKSRKLGTNQKTNKSWAGCSKRPARLREAAFSLGFGTYTL